MSSAGEIAAGDPGENAPVDIARGVETGRAQARQGKQDTEVSQGQGAGALGASLVTGAGGTVSEIAASPPVSAR